MPDYQFYCFPGWHFSGLIFEHTIFAKFNYMAFDYDEMQDVALFDRWQGMMQQQRTRPILVGWSFGGLTAIKLAYRYSAHIKAMILISSQPQFLAEENWPGIDKILLEAFLKQADLNYDMLIKKFLALTYYPSTNRSGKNLLAKYILKNICLKRELKQDCLFDLRALYHSLNIPILHIAGEDDVVIRQSEIALNNLNHTIEFTKIKNAGHASFLTHNQTFNRIVLDFLKRIYVNNI